MRYHTKEGFDMSEVLMNSENDRIIPTKEINITRHDMEDMK